MKICEARIIILMVLSVSFFLIFISDLTAEEAMTNEDLFEMSLEDLMNVEIESTASLTGATRRLQPSAITTISGDEIQSSGARSLLELLDIYVPNLQWIRAQWEPDNMGLRGIMSDRDDKYLLLVNGRVMNERLHYGVRTEKDLVLLGDIHHIDIIRGPGSALYGPGAVSMVVNIVTYTSETFEGTEVTTRAGYGEEFYSVEVKHGRKFEDGDGGLFLYTGIGSYQGADEHDSPVVLAGDFPTTTGWWDPAWGAGPGPFPADGYQAGTALTGASIPNDGEDHKNLPPLKIHAEITKGNWDIWARYTRGGKQFMWDKGYIARNPVGWTESYWDWGSSSLIPLRPNSYGYQQATGFVGYKDEISDATSIEYSFSLDMTDNTKLVANNAVDDHREDKYYGKAILRHNFSERHKVAVGVDAAHFRFRANSGDRWSTEMYSLLGEYQWTMSDQWTLFAGGRLDDHTYSEVMFSPRASLLFAPNEKDVYKFMWASSVRANFEEEMRNGALNGNPDGAPEKLDSFEFRYERQHSKSLDLAASVYVHYDLDLISWSGVANAAVPVGTQRDWGIELEAYYHTDKTRFGISHAFAKLYDFNLESGQSTIVTSMPYGYGDDFARWSNHITKLTVHHQMDEKWAVDGSLRIYWGFAGMEDYDNYERSTGTTYIESGWQRSYRGNYYLDLGVQFQPRENLTFRLDGMNLLGIFNEDFNKRNYNGQMYRSHAPSLMLTMRCTF